MNAAKGLVRYATTLTVAAFAVLGIVVACGDTPLDAAGGDGKANPVRLQRLRNAASWMPCNTPVACRKEATGSDNFIFCMEGTRSCTNGVYGDCVAGAPVASSTSLEDERSRYPTR